MWLRFLPRSLEPRGLGLSCSLLSFEPVPLYWLLNLSVFGCPVGTARLASRAVGRIP